MSELLVNTIKKADGTGSLSIPAESGTVVVKDGSNDVTLNNITATGVYLGGTGSANYLQEYEKGTWTPVFLGSSGQSGQVYNKQEGSYVRVGRQVICQYHIILTTAGTFSGVYLLIGGLPFTFCDTPVTGTISVGTPIYFTSLAGNWIWLGLQGKENDNKAYIFGKDSAGASRQYLGTSGLSNNAQLTGTIIYEIEDA